MEELVVNFNEINKLIEKEVGKSGSKSLCYQGLANKMECSLSHFRNLVFKQELNNFSQLNALAKALNVNVTRLITVKVDNSKSAFTVI